MKKKQKFGAGTRKKKEVLKEKKIEEQDFIDERKEVEDHNDPDYPFEEPVKPSPATEAEKENNAK